MILDRPCTSIKVKQEGKTRQFNPVGDKKDMLMSFLQYLRSFQEIEDHLKYKSLRPATPVVTSEDENFVGFGKTVQKHLEGNLEHQG